MTKITLLITAFMLLPVTDASSQCNDTAAPVPLPYSEDFNGTTVPYLPECTYSIKQTFVGSEWETASNPGTFDGNLLFYNTNSPENWGMSASYFTRLVQLNAGTSYKVSYKYAHDSDTSAIDTFTTALYNNVTNVIPVGNHENIGGTAIVSYSSGEFTPTVSGIYVLRLDIMATASQGALYVDDITIEEWDTMATGDFNNDGFVLYPNPANDKVTISCALPIDRIELYTLTGQLVLTDQPYNENSSLNLEKVAAGIYQLNVFSNETVKAIKLIKE